MCHVARACTAQREFVRAAAKLANLDRVVIDRGWRQAREDGCPGIDACLALAVTHHDTCEQMVRQRGGIGALPVLW